MSRRRALAHPIPTGQTHLPIKLHGEYAPALPAARKGQTGRVLLRPQPDYPTATVADFRTAVSIKHVLGFTRFLMRGIENVKNEWLLATLAYNCKRLRNLKAA